MSIISSSNLPSICLTIHTFHYLSIQLSLYSYAYLFCHLDSACPTPIRCWNICSYIVPLPTLECTEHACWNCSCHQVINTLKDWRLDFFMMAIPLFQQAFNLGNSLFVRSITIFWICPFHN